MSAAPVALRRLTQIAAVAFAAIVYARLVRKRVCNWGATRREATGSLPGDELLPDADGVATRAISVAASASAVWPWIAQMGPSPRGGAYTYDWIENLLGLDMHSADRVLPEFQHPRVGDAIGYGANVMRVERAEPGRCLAWRSGDGNWVWSFVLAGDGASTRLISRNRFRLPSPAARLGMLLLEPASLVMERKMLRGIKQRAERLAADGGGEERRRHEMPKLDPDAPPAARNGEWPAPAHPFKDQGDALASPERAGPRREERADE